MVAIIEVLFGNKSWLVFKWHELGRLMIDSITWLVELVVTAAKRMVSVIVHHTLVVIPILPVRVLLCLTDVLLFVLVLIMTTILVVFVVVVVVTISLVILPLILTRPLSVLVLPLLVKSFSLPSSVPLIFELSYIFYFVVWSTAILLSLRISIV